MLEAEAAAMRLPDGPVTRPKMDARGQWLYFVGMGEHRLMRVDLATGAAEPVPVVAGATITNYMIVP